LNTETRKKKVLHHFYKYQKKFISLVLFVLLFYVFNPYFCNFKLL